MEEENRNKEGVWQALSLAWQLGYSIAIPLVLFALGGRLLDKYLNTSPWLLLAGIFISLILSTILVYNKSIAIIAEAEQDNQKDNNL